MSKNWRITIASPPDREHLVAEIFFGNQQWDEIDQESQALIVEFYPRSDPEPWRISFDDALSALHEARGLLVG